MMEQITKNVLDLGFAPEGAQLYHDDSERALIGACLISDEIMDQPRVSVVEPEDFYIPSHKLIWRCMKNLKKQGMAVDIITIAGEYQRIGRERDLDMAYLMGTINTVVNTYHGDGYANQILEDSARRRTLKLANELATRAFDYEQPITETASFAITNSSTILRSGGEARHWAESIEKVRARVENRMQNPSDIWGIASGIKDLDYAMGGFQVGLNMLAGSPGAGKSILYNQILLQMASGLGDPAGTRRMHPVGLFSMEMGNEQNTMRNLSQLAKIATRKMKTGFMSAEEYNVFLDNCRSAAQLPVYQSDRATWAVGELRAELARLKAEYNIEAAMIDYLFLMVPSVNLRMEPYQKAEWLSGQLKQIATELNLVLLVINSVTKEQMASEAPGQEGMKGGGQVHHDADMIAMLTHYKNPSKTKPGQIVIPDEYIPNVRALWITKGREIENGLTRVLLYKSPVYPFFADMIVDGQINWNAVGNKTAPAVPVRSNGHAKPAPEPVVDEPQGWEPPSETALAF